jgi:hypothetical protein
VYAPDPGQLTTPEVNVLLWFHGDKSVWSKHRSGTLDLTGKSVQDYLQLEETKLREFVLKSSKRKFLLVIPTLTDQSGSVATPGGLLWKQDQLEAYLKQVFNGVNKYMGKNVTGLKNLVVAAHSGGGHLLAHVAGKYGGDVGKSLKELWCFDCTYWGGLSDWAKSHSSDCKLWVYSTGESRCYKLADPSQKEGPDNPRNVPDRCGTGDTAKSLLDLSKKLPASATTVEVLIEAYSGNLLPTDSTTNFVAKYGMPDGKRHYESIETCFANVLDSTNKKLDF